MKTEKFTGQNSNKVLVELGRRTGGHREDCKLMGLILSELKHM